MALKLIDGKWAFGLDSFVLKAPEDGTGTDTGTEPSGQTEKQQENQTETLQESAETTQGGQNDAEGRPWRNPKVEQRIADLTKQRYAAEAEARQLKERLSTLENNNRPKDPNEIPAEVLQAKLAELRFIEKSNELFTKGTKKFGDFPAVVQEVKTALGGFPNGVIEAAMELDNPEEVLYHLGKDLGTAGDIFSLGAARQGAAVARFAGSIGKAQSQVSKAPPPIVPVNGVVKKEFTAENTELPIAEWMKARQNQSKVR